jgi:flavin-dependent dehydrogenase
MEIYDAIIVGGGPAGSSAAIHLARRGARVLLAEQERFPRAKLCGEFISPECLDHFQRLGALQPLSTSGGVPVGETIFYTTSGRDVAVPSAWFGNSGGAALGLSRAEMDRRLLESARVAGVEVLEEATASNLLLEDKRVNGVRLNMPGGETREVRARLTLDATGRQRLLSKLFQRATAEESDRRRAELVAFKAHLENTEGTSGVCEIYFYPGGYGGLSPVENGLSNLCFIVRAGDVRERGSDPARLMKDVVMKNKRAARTLGRARADDRWLGVALENFGRNELVTAEGLIAIGDAASFIDPFTGSGILMALESGEVAAEVTSDWLRSPFDEGRTFEALARDYRARYSERFDARLRICGLLRRAAFAPRVLTEVVALAFNTSARLRQIAARATRRGSSTSSTNHDSDSLLTRSRQ